MRNLIVCALALALMAQAKYAKRCSSTYECEVMKAMGGSAVKAICCGTNQCNR
ncbi:hypothetical protein UY3_04313 [Chelonia mydas]|uniref:Uncharacterized protein n=1 Tax=Chelonia mydas TaxID=8469 RepID=M7BKM9_CHEMY|nr:hypothetical protein UY3_04313 [Chelonia mydas]